MNIDIISIGKFKKNDPQKEIFENYIKRIKWNINLQELLCKNPTNKNCEIDKEKEGKLLLEHIKHNSKIILLDERGKNFTSLEFANLLEKHRDNADCLSFIIGGANGTSDEVKRKAALILSFGAMTFPHLMIRSILAEQIYRSYSIINNHPYHKI